MRDRLRLLATAFALTLALPLALPPATAQAQGTDQYSDGETVTVDFELSITGGVPGWQYFYAEQGGGLAASELPLCTTHTERPGPGCEDGGTYTASAEVPAGEPVDFTFVRDGDPGPSETFTSGARTFTQDTTVRAAYDFPGEEPPEPVGEPSGETSGNVDDQYATDDTPQPPAPDEGAPNEAPDDGSEPAGSTDDSALPPRLPDTGGLPLAAGLGLVAAGLGLALMSRRLRR